MYHWYKYNEKNIFMTSNKKIINNTSKKANK